MEHVSHTKSWEELTDGDWDAACTALAEFQAQYRSTRISGSWLRPQPFFPGYLRVTVHEGE